MKLKDVFVSKSNRYRQCVNFFFVFICKITCAFNEKNFRDIIFEV